MSDTTAPHCVACALFGTCASHQPTRPATMPNPYGSIDTKPEPKVWTEAQRRAGEAIANAIRR